VELHEIISSLCQSFEPLPLPDSEEEMALQLKNLYLVEDGINGSREDSTLSKERELKSRVCKTVLTSYDMSLRDTAQLASAKLQLARVLTQQLGGQIGSVAVVSEERDTPLPVHQKQQHKHNDP